MVLSVPPDPIPDIIPESLLNPNRRIPIDPAMPTKAEPMLIKSISPNSAMASVINQIAPAIAKTWPVLTELVKLFKASERSSSNCLRPPTCSSALSNSPPFMKFNKKFPMLPSISFILSNFINPTTAPTPAIPPVNVCIKLLKSRDFPASETPPSFM